LRYPGPYYTTVFILRDGGDIKVETGESLETAVKERKSKITITGVGAWVVQVESKIEKRNGKREEDKRRKRENRKRD